MKKYNEGRLNLLEQALKELSFRLNDSISTPASLSLFLLSIGIDDPLIKNQICDATVDLVLNSKQPMALTLNDFQARFSAISPAFSKTDIDEGYILYIVTYIGLYITPAVYPVAKNL